MVVKLIITNIKLTRQKLKQKTFPELPGELFAQIKSNLLCRASHASGVRERVPGPARRAGVAQLGAFAFPHPV